MEQDNALVHAIPSPPCAECGVLGSGTTSRYCTACGYPIGGTSEEQSVFKAKKAKAEYARTLEAQHVKKARNVLYWVAGLNMLPYVIEYANSKEPLIIVVGLVISAIYLALAYWSRTKPFPAILTALVLFVSLILLTAILEPLSLFSGLILKVIVLSALIYALRSIKSAENAAR